MRKNLVYFAYQEKNESKLETIQNTNNDLIKKMISLQEILSSKEKEIISLKKLNGELNQSNLILNTQIDHYKIIIEQNKSNHICKG